MTALEGSPRDCLIDGLTHGHCFECTGQIRAGMQTHGYTAGTQAERMVLHLTYLKHVEPESEADNKGDVHLDRAVSGGGSANHRCCQPANKDEADFSEAFLALEASLLPSTNGLFLHPRSSPDLDMQEHVSR